MCFIKIGKVWVNMEQIQTVKTIKEEGYVIRFSNGEELEVQTSEGILAMATFLEGNTPEG